ncbi:alpha/beta hydrolase [Leucobacter insecticola]|uniref:Alpha/beta hydrolase n=1 Tax=Leucobacter insecticola TaxID=2714934 RepID=A0A6G8FGX8_9MICO|nr:alpha/beta hydrolase [Leucobacter insecticola]QIM15533.1 alpha/beta hydrolase [Leucobacter insecticola]
MTVWREDVLGAGFECTDLELGSDSEGPLVAALVRALPTPRGLWERILGRERSLEDVDVLYVHGWSDYFFQRQLAEFWTSRGARFFALDLRKYGRSLREGQTPGYIEDLDEYRVEIELAINEIRESQDPAATRRKLVLLGHSTGGLVLSLWAHKHPGYADALILNSPWLEFQLTGTVRQVVAPIFNLRAKFSPHDLALQADLGFYMRAQQQTCSPQELNTINLQWRPERAHAALNGWMRAVLLGHARVSEGLSIDAPVAVLLSKRSVLALKWSEDMTRADTVLDVGTIAEAALRLGDCVTVCRIDGALHDVFLSSPEPRAEAYAQLERWLIGWQAATRHNA